MENTRMGHGWGKPRSLRPATVQSVANLPHLFSLARLFGKRAVVVHTFNLALGRHRQAGLQAQF